MKNTFQCFIAFCVLRASRVCVCVCARKRKFVVLLRNDKIHLADFYAAAAHSYQALMARFL